MDSAELEWIAWTNPITTAFGKEVAANGTPAEYGAVLRHLTETVAFGNGTRPNDMVEQITGAPSRKFRDFARKNAAGWKDA